MPSLRTFPCKSTPNYTSHKGKLGTLALLRKSISICFLDLVSSSSHACGGGGDVQSLSCIQRFVTGWTIACQAPLSVGFPRQEYWSGLPFPSPGHLPDPGIEPVSIAWQADSLPLHHLGGPFSFLVELNMQTYYLKMNSSLPYGSVPVIVHLFTLLCDVLNHLAK